MSEYLRLLGEWVTMIAIGAVFGQTVFEPLSEALGISILVGSIVWVVIGVLTMLLAIYTEN